MSATWAIRLAILLLSIGQAAISAVLGFSEILPIEAKIALIAASAGIAVALNQIPSWAAAPHAARALKRAGAD